MQCIVIITIYTKFFPHQACDGMLVISSYDDIIYPLLTYINKAAYIYNHSYILNVIIMSSTFERLELNLWILNNCEVKEVKEI